MKNIKSFVFKIFEHDYLGMSAEMGYWMTLGIFPLLFFIVSLFGFLGKKSLMSPVFAFLSHILPMDAYNLIQDVLDEIMIFKQGKLVAILGICVTVFLASNAIFCVIKGLNRAYGIEETRSLIFTRILSIVMVFVNAFVLFIVIKKKADTNNLLFFAKDKNS